jgi:uncharacterized damage-inducible protein DinB
MESDRIKELYRYNSWANERMFEATSRLTTEQYKQDMHSSFPSVRNTFVHIISVEWLYLQRVKGTSPKGLWSASDYPTVASLKERWIELKREQMAFIDALTEEQCNKQITYTNIAGKSYTYPLRHILSHVVNHSTYHRGQLTTMIRQLGSTPESTDLLLFYDLRNKS